MLVCITKPLFVFRIPQTKNRTKLCVCDFYTRPLCAGSLHEGGGGGGEGGGIGGS